MRGGAIDPPPHQRKINTQAYPISQSLVSSGNWETYTKIRLFTYRNYCIRAYGWSKQVPTFTHILILLFAPTLSLMWLFSHYHICHFSISGSHCCRDLHCPHCSKFLHSMAPSIRDNPNNLRMKFPRLASPMWEKQEHVYPHARKIVSGFLDVLEYLNKIFILRWCLHSGVPRGGIGIYPPKFKKEANIWPLIWG